MKHFKRIFFPLFIALSAHGLSAQDTWYVSVTGSNANPGTIDKPFRTIQHACNIVDPGDTVVLRGGIYRNEQVVLSRSGTPSQWITFRNYPGEEPILQYSIDMTGETDWIDQGNNLWHSKNGSFAWEVNHDVATIWHDGTSHWSYKKYNPGEQQKQWDFYHNLSAGRVEVYSTANPATLVTELEIPVDPGTTQNQFNLTCRASYIIWDGLSIRYCNMHGMQVASGQHHVIFRNGSITHGGGGNVWPGRTPKVRWGDALDVTGSVHDVIFENNYLAEWPDGTLTNQGNNGQQYNLWFINNYVARSTNGFHCWFGSTEPSENENNWLRNIYYEGNVFEDIGQGWFEDRGVMQGAIQFNPRNGVNATDIYIRNNTFINCGTDRFEAGTWRGVNCAINIGGGDVTVSGNIIYGGESQGIEIHTTHQAFTGEVYNNLIYGTPWSGLRIDGDGKTPGTRVYNNTVVNCGSSTRANIALFNMSGSFEFFNNISYSTVSPELHRSGGGTFDYNCYGSYSGPGTHSVTGDPLFRDPAADNYRITRLSPCFNAARAEGAPAIDLDSLPRPVGAEVDMGAYEYPYPQIRIRSSAEDSLLFRPATVSFTAAVSMNEHPLEKVEFFTGDSLLEVISSEPWEFTWNDVESGEHEVHGLGTDTAGNIFRSGVIAFTVLPSAPPRATLLYPEEGTIVEQGDTVLFRVDADDDGKVVSVEFILDSEVVGVDTAVQFRFSWIAEGVRDHTLKARATDNHLQTVETAAVQFSVRERGRNISYYEDFNEGIAQDWEHTSGIWEVREQEFWNSSNGPLELSIYRGTTFARLVYAVRLKATWNNPFGMVFNYLDENNYSLVSLDPSPSGVTLSMVADGTETILAENSFQGIKAEAWTTVTMENDGALTSLRIGDSMVFDSIPTPDQRYGHIGLFSAFNWMWADDVHVEADSTELTVSMTGETNRLPGIRIFPNPVTGQKLSILTPAGIVPAQVELFSLDGKKLHSLQVRSELTEIELSESMLPGIYLLLFIGRSVQIAGKLVVQ